MHLALQYLPKYPVKHNVWATTFKIKWTFKVYTCICVIIKKQMFTYTIYSKLLQYEYLCCHSNHKNTLLSRYCSMSNILSSWNVYACYLVDILLIHYRYLCYSYILVDSLLHTGDKDTVMYSLYHCSLAYNLK